MSLLFWTFLFLFSFSLDPFSSKYEQNNKKHFFDILIYNKDNQL